MAMIAVIVAMAGACLAAGILLILAGNKPRPARPAPAVRRRRRISLTRRQQLVIVAGALVGVVVALITGWWPAIAAVPVAALGVPWLLQTNVNREQIQRLEAMEEWTRALAGVLAGGQSLKSALQATLRSTPAPIRKEVADLVNRMEAGMETELALRMLGDDLDDPTGDIVVINLLSGAKSTKKGLAAVLQGLAASVAIDVSDRRALEAEARKVQGTVRLITIITIAFLGLLLLFGGSFLAPYGTPLGGVLLTILLSIYAGLLVWLRRMSQTKPLPRFMGPHLGGKSR